MTTRGKAIALPLVASEALEQRHDVTIIFNDTDASGLQPPTSIHLSTGVTARWRTAWPTRAAAESSVAVMSCAMALVERVTLTWPAARWDSLDDLTDRAEPHLLTPEGTPSASRMSPVR